HAAQRRPAGSPGAPSGQERCTMTDKTMPASPSGSAVATLAGGCFRCLDAVYRQVRGVNDVVSGYAGGRVANPDYYGVSSGRTGHAEAVQVHFDPAQITYQ